MIHLHFSGTKVTTRCLQLIKPFIRKDLLVDDDDDDNEDSAAAAAALSTGRIMERDILLQGYQLGEFGPSIFHSLVHPF